MSLARTATLLAATITSGLIAGLFYAYSVSVMPGLRHSSDRSMVEVFNNINVSIQNPLFFLSFMGAPITIAIAAFLQWRAGGDRRVFGWLVAGFVFIMLMIIITAGANIPLNNDLANVGLSSPASALAAAREKFETTWVAWNVVRTLSSIAGFGCVGWALFTYGRLKSGSAG